MFSTDSLSNFYAREARAEQSHAASLSQSDGRSLDAYGFVDRPAFDSPPVPIVNAELAAVRRRKELKQQLSLARFVSQVKAEAAAEVAENRRRATEEFELPKSIREVMTVAEMFPELYWSFKQPVS